MRIVIKSYSILRDILGENIVLELNKPISVGEVVSYLREKYNIPGEVEIIVIIDNEIRDENYIVSGDTTIHITPPFAGGGVFVDIRILREGERIDLNDLVTRLTKIDLETGAISVFIGFVKGRVHGSDVYELEYSSIEEMAIRQLEKITREESERYGLRGVVIWHYVGRLKPGDLTIVIATVARDRHVAFKATETILERVKREVPIFKLEKRSDGYYWVIGDGRRYRSISYK